MKEQYNQLTISKLPNDVIAVFATIRKYTAEFTNKVAIGAHKQNFERIMELVKLKFPKAIKGKERAKPEMTKKQLIEAKIKGFITAAKFVKGKQKTTLEAKIKGFETALGFA